MPTLHPVRRLQALDVEAAALREERAGLAERLALAEHRAECTELAQRRSDVDEALLDLGRRERELEGAVSDAAARAGSVEQDLYSGRVTAAKELEALQAELASWRSRQGRLEEQELELMEAAERAVAEASSMEARTAELEAAILALEKSLAAAEARIDGQLAAVAESRAEVCADVEARLLAAYEKRHNNPRLAGVITAELQGNRCGRCKVSIPVVEVTRIKAEGADGFAVCHSCHRLVLP